MSIQDIEFLTAFGFDGFFDRQRADLGSLPVAKVIHEEKNLFRIQTSFTDFRWAEISGRYYFDVKSPLDLPAVGDWVTFKPLEGSDRAVIQNRFDRKTCLYRSAVGSGGLEQQILGTNVDTAFVMTSLNQDLNPRRLERYFALCLDSGVDPILVLTKRDLLSEEDFFQTISELNQQFSKIDVIGVSVKSELGLSELQKYLLRGKTVALFGSSGVGKSSLTNYLLQRQELAVNDIRDGDDKGKHTTTGRYLFLLPNGGLLMDTPGMRELQLFQHQDGLAEVFDDIEALTLRCKFSNCTHDAEPGCAVKAEIESGAITEKRWAGYQKLLRELAYQERKLSKAAQKIEKDKWKKIHMELRRR